jgi:hypothetical protein
MVIIGGMGHPGVILGAIARRVQPLRAKQLNGVPGSSADFTPRVNPWHLRLLPAGLMVLRPEGFSHPADALELHGGSTGPATSGPVRPHALTCVRTDDRAGRTVAGGRPADGSGPPRRHQHLRSSGLVAVNDISFTVPQRAIICSSG